MNIKSTFNTQKKLLLAFFSLLLVCFASAYSLAMAHDSKKKNADVNVVLANSAKQKFKLVSDDLTYFDEGGDKYVLENGKRRAMTKSELSNFEQLMNGINIENNVNGALPGHRIISIHSTSGDGDVVDLSDVLQGMKGLKEPEALKYLEGLKELESLADLDIDVQVLSSVEHSFSDAEHELEDALRSIENANLNEKANKAELKKVAKELKEMQKQLAKDKERMSESREKARFAAKKAREQIQRGAH